MNKILEDAGVEPQFEEGIRVTDPKTLGIARKLFLEANMDLVLRLRQDWGVPARPITAGVLTADYLDKDKWEYVGKITDVNTRPIDDAIRAGKYQFFAPWQKPKTVKSSMSTQMS